MENENENLLEIMSHFNNPTITKIILEDDDGFTLIEEKDKYAEEAQNETRTVNSTSVKFKPVHIDLRENSTSFPSNLKSVSENEREQNLLNKQITSDEFQNEFNKDTKNEPLIIQSSDFNVSKTFSKEYMNYVVRRSSKDALSQEISTCNSSERKTLIQQILESNNSYNINVFNGNKANSFNISTQNEEVEKIRPKKAAKTNQSKRKRTKENSENDFVEASTLSHDTVNLSSTIKLISEHLVCIIKYEKFFTPNNNIQAPAQFLNNLQRKKLLAKYYFFRLSYSTTLMLLIPQENNEPFVRNFIEGTVKLSQNMNVHTTFSEVSLLYSEMLAWTKQEQIETKKALEKISKVDITIHPSYQPSVAPTNQSNAPNYLPQVKGYQDVNQSQFRQELHQQQPVFQNRFVHCEQRESNKLPTYEQYLSQGARRTLPQQLPPEPTFIKNTRSMSRDSGIASPCPNVEITMADQWEFRPQIIQVESKCPTFQNKNKQAFQGSCFVCHTLTRKLCLGCCKVYYCSLECQKVNFFQHMPVCKLSTN